MRGLAVLVTGALAFAIAHDARPARAGDDPPRAASVPKDAWAVVGSSAITKAEVERRAKLLALLIGMPNVPDSAALDAVVDERTVVIHLDEAGVGPGSVTPQELAEARRSLDAQAPGAGAELDRRLRDAGLDADFDQQMRVSVALRKLISREIDDAALAATFEKHKVALCDGEVRARGIFVFVRSGEESKALERATALLKQIAPDGSNMEALARAQSDDPNAPLTGGDLDYFGMASRRIPPEVKRVCLEKGHVGLIPEPVRTRDGYCVLYVTATRIFGDSKLDAHKEVVRNLCLAEKTMAHLKAWKEAAKVEYAPDAPRTPK